MRPVVEVKPGVWLRSGVPLMLTDPVTQKPVQCSHCGGDAWTVQEDAALKCDGCGTRGRAT